jgi:hypothetical protein
MSNDQPENYARVEQGNDVFYSIYSKYDGEIVHVSPDQLQELSSWLAEHSEVIGQDVERRNSGGAS